MTLTLVFLIFFCITNASAGGTNSVFLRLDNMLGEMEQNHFISPEEAWVWKDEIQELRNKVDDRIKQNGGGMNRYQDKDLYDQIDSEGKKVFTLYQRYKKQPSSN